MCQCQIKCRYVVVSEAKTKESIIPGLVRIWPGHPPFLGSSITVSLLYVTGYFQKLFPYLNPLGIFRNFFLP